MCLATWPYAGDRARFTLRTPAVSVHLLASAPSVALAAAAVASVVVASAAAVVVSAAVVAVDLGAALPVRVQADLVVAEAVLDSAHLPAAIAAGVHLLVVQTKAREQLVAPRARPASSALSRKSSAVAATPGATSTKSTTTNESWGRPRGSP